MKSIINVFVFVGIILLVTSQVATAEEPGDRDGGTPEVILDHNITMSIQGICEDFNVTIYASGFESGYYDVKVDVFHPTQGRVGRIYDPTEGWKSSIYYVDMALQIFDNTTNASGVFEINAETRLDELNFQVKLRKASETWESEYFMFLQDCPESEGFDDFPVESHVHIVYA